MSFERGRYHGLQYYKWKQSSRGVPYTGDLKEKAKVFENYLRRVYFSEQLPLISKKIAKEDKP